jgi:hypothetical protein
MFSGRISLGEVEVVHGGKWFINRDAVPVKEVWIMGLTWCSWYSRDLEGGQGKGEADRDDFLQTEGDFFPLTS